MANDRFPDDKRENDACNVQNGFRFLSLVAHTHLRPDLLRAASRQGRIRREDMCPGWVVFRAAGAECFAKAGGIGAPCGRTVLFWTFPYVCPEPVLVKCSFSYINGSKKAFSAPAAGVVERYRTTGRSTTAAFLLRAKKTPSFFSSWEFVLRVFVSSLSWQIHDRDFNEK